MWTIIIVIVGVVVIGILAVVCFVLIALYGGWKWFSPNSPDEQIKEFGTKLINYDFGDAYKVIESSSRNNHPDRPQHLAVQLSDVECEKLRNHIMTLSHNKEKTVKDGQYYVKEIIDEGSKCTIIHSAFHTDCDYMFFRAGAIIDYTQRTVTFSSSFY